MAKAKLKTVKKKWYDIEMPAFFDKILVGKTYLSNPELAVGRKLSVNYAIISGDPQKQNINLKLKITKVENEKLLTQVLGLELQQSIIKRFVRKGKTRIDDSFLAKTKDNFNVRVKPLLITRFRASGGLTNSIIKKLKEFLLEELKKKKLEEIIKELLHHKFQKSIFEVFKKIYPLSVAEIRCIEIVE